LLYAAFAIHICVQAASVFLLVFPFVFLWQMFPSQRKKSFVYKVNIWLFVFYMCGIIWVTGLPTLADGMRLDFNLTLEPLHRFYGDRLQYFLNVLLFVPLGFLLPFIWKRYHPMRRTVLFSFGLSLFIELSQLFCARITDINDLFMNTLGGILGWFLWFCGRRFYIRAECGSHAVPVVILVILAHFLGGGYIQM